MTDTNKNAQIDVQARPGGKGTGKVTAGHGRGPRKDAHPQGRQNAKTASGKRRRMGGPQERRSQTPRINVKDVERRQGGRNASSKEGFAGKQASGMKQREAAMTGVATESPVSARIRDRKRLSEKMNRSTRLKLWLQSSAFDFALVLIVASALVYTISFGFNSAWIHRENIVLTMALVTPLLMVMFAGSWSKRALLPSIACTVVLTVLYVAAASALSPESGAMFVDGSVNDVPENYSLYAIVLCVITVLVYLLSRRTVGLVFLLVASVTACGAVQYLWREWTEIYPGMFVTVVVVVGLGMLFVYQCYRQSVYSANRVKRTSFLGAFGYSALVAVACVLVGAAGFYGVVSTLGLSTPDFRPFEQHVSPPLDEKANSYQKLETESDDTSANTNEDEDQAHDADSGGNQSGMRGEGLLADSFISDAAQLLAGYDPDDPSQDFQNISYLVIVWEMVIIAVLIALALLASVLFQRYRRKLRLMRIAGRSPGYQVWYLYTFLIGRLGRLKINKPDHLTPLEFAVGFSKPMLPFTRGTDGVDFVDVSSVYQDAAFGGISPTDEDLEDVIRYYRSFFKNAREYVGWPKWLLWKFWRI